jgi:hypothetical protein
LLAALNLPKRWDEIRPPPRPPMRDFVAAVASVRAAEVARLQRMIEGFVSQLMYIRSRWRRSEIAPHGGDAVKKNRKSDSAHCKEIQKAWALLDAWARGGFLELEDTTVGIAGWSVVNVQAGKLPWGGGVVGADVAERQAGLIMHGRAPASRADMCVCVCACVCVCVCVRERQ